VNTVTRKQTAAAALVVALAAGSVAQQVVGAEAAVLGLTTVEVVLLGLVVGAALTRHAL